MCAISQSNSSGTLLDSELRSYVQIPPPGPFQTMRKLRHQIELVLGCCQTVCPRKESIGQVLSRINK